MPADYEIPQWGGSTDKLHGWLMEAVAEGEIWLGAQKPTIEWPSVVDVLGPQYNGGSVGAGNSQTGYNVVRHDFEQIRATLSNFRHAGEFIPTEDDAQQFFDRAHLITNLDRDWEKRTFSNLKIRDALSYALAKGTAYLYEDWDSAAMGPGRGDIRLQVFDPSNVTFLQLPPSHDIQQAYGVLIKQEIPLLLAKRMFASKNSSFAADLRADSEQPGVIEKGRRFVQRYISPLLNSGGSIRKTNEAVPTVFIWTLYTLDGAVNERPEAIQMGTANTNWGYTVPALGDPIPQPMRNPRTGQLYTLPAGPGDCLMFPLRRMTVFSRTGVSYDNSSPWWHGQVPLARMRLKDRPWEALGASQVGDALQIQVGLINLIRGVEDAAAARVNPAAIYDDTRVDKTWAEAFNPMKAGARAGADLSQGDPIVFPVPLETYNVPAWIVSEGGFIAQQERRINKITCAEDMIAVAKARQIPSADTLEKMLEMAGPIVQDMTQSLIEPITQLGEWRKAYYFQFYTKARMIRIADPEGTELLSGVKYSTEHLDRFAKMTTRTDDGAVVSRDWGAVKKVSPEDIGIGQDPSAARVYLSDFRYEVTESGLSELNRMSQTLLYLQLTKSGTLPISWWTMAKVARVPNYGPPPVGTNTEMERVIAQRNIEMEMAAEAAQAAAPPQPAVPGQGGNEGPGRPASFQKSPQIKNKPGEGRSTVTTS